MNLPFLKARRTPRVKVENEDDSYEHSPDEDAVINSHLSHELISALETKDVRLFRDALEALVLNAFEQKEDDASNSR